jgi:hypothetical protein
VLRHLPQHHTGVFASLFVAPNCGVHAIYENSPGIQEVAPLTFTPV